jgi:hypothetical protein
MFLGMFYIVAMPVWSMSSEYKVLPIFTGILSGFGLFLLISTLCFQAGQWPFAKEMVTATPLMVLPILAAVGLIVLIAKEKAGFVWHHSKFRWLFTTIAFIYVCQLPLLAFWKSIFIEVAQGK